jgi:hypothetical protein
MDCLLPFFHGYRSVWIWDVQHDSFCLATRYVHPWSPLKETSEMDPTPKATATSDIPLDEFQFCVYHRWRIGEIAYAGLTGAYGTPPSVCC